MPVEDQNEFHETILRGNLSMDINTNTNATSQQPALTGGYSPESVPSTDSNFSTSVKSNLSHSSSKARSDVVHRVTFSESHCVKDVDSGNISVIQDNQCISSEMRALPGESVSRPLRLTQNNSSPTAGASASSWPSASKMSPTATNFFTTPNGRGGSGTSNTTTATNGGQPPSILRLQKSPSTESHENPFQNDGMLSKKADYIVRNSTISRTELKIADPDSEKERKAKEAAAVAAQEECIAAETIVASEATPALQACPPDDVTDGGPAERPNDIKVNGNVEEQQPLTPQSVEVKVGQANASQPQAQQAEEVKLPKNKCKCCVVQ